MTFTNITQNGIYMLCCHREVEPGGSFSLPWEQARVNRGVRAAMTGGAFAWVSDAGEPNVAGSPALPDSQADERRQAAAAAEKAEHDRRVAEQRAKDDEAVKENMARMGDFKVPQVGAYGAKARVVAKERPVTSDDVIADDKPKSLADILRHNKAVKMEQSKSSERNEHEEV